MNIIKLKLNLLSLLIILTSNASLASTYPKTPLENEMQEMGSVLGSKGIVFSSDKEKSKVTQKKINNVSQYLLQAAIEVLKFAPLASVDSNSGTVITEWYHPQSEQNTQFKVVVYIKKETASPEELEVIVFERKKVRNDWVPSQKSQAVASVLENKIAKKARDLYLQSDK